MRQKFPSRPTANPQELKPDFVASPGGTAKAVPLTGLWRKLFAQLSPQLWFALLFALAATLAHAQISSPDQLIARPPHNPARSQRAAAAPDDLQWLWQYAKPEPNGRASSLRLDRRFQNTLDREFKQPQAMWGPVETPEPLPTIIPLFLTRYGAVTTEKNRYFTVDGCVPRFCPAQGLLWIDLGKRDPLIVFAAANWSTQGHTTDEAAADFDLWLFSNHQLDANALPFALSESIAHWNARLASAGRLVPHIAHAVLVEPDGKPYPLDPTMAGANTLKPQPDTLTPKEADDE